MNAQTVDATGWFRLTKENARFVRSAGGLLALEYKTEDGRTVKEDRVIVLRSFPLTAPDSFLSVRRPEPDRPEIGIVTELQDLDEESESLVSEELARRYFVPKIRHIFSLHRKGIIYIKVDTDVGRRLLRLRDTAASFRPLDDGRVILNDLDGSCYEITNPQELDHASYRKIEIFL